MKQVEPEQKSPAVKQAYKDWHFRLHMEKSLPSKVPPEVADRAVKRCGFAVNMINQNYMDLDWNGKLKVRCWAAKMLIDHYVDIKNKITQDQPSSSSGSEGQVGSEAAAGEDQATTRKQDERAAVMEVDVPVQAPAASKAAKRKAAMQEDVLRVHHQVRALNALNLEPSLSGGGFP